MDASSYAAWVDALANRHIPAATANVMILRFERETCGKRRRPSGRDVVTLTIACAHFGIKWWIDSIPEHSCTPGFAKFAPNGTTLTPTIDTGCSQVMRVRNLAGLICVFQ